MKIQKKIKTKQLKTIEIEIVKLSEKLKLLDYNSFNF